MFYNLASIYHPQRRAILHLKHLKQERQKFKQRLPNQKSNGGDHLKTTYKLSDHFRQQSLEIAARADLKRNERRNGSVSSGISSGGANHSNASNLTANPNTSSTNSHATNRNLNYGGSNNNVTNAKSNSNANNKSSTNTSGCGGQSTSSSKFKTNNQTEEQRSSSFFERRSTRESRIKFQEKLSSFICLNRRQCLSKLTKLIQSTSLTEYLDLLRSRDLKFIIIFSILCSFTHFYLAVVSWHFFSKRSIYKSPLTYSEGQFVVRTLRTFFLKTTVSKIF